MADDTAEARLAAAMAAAQDGDAAAYRSLLTEVVPIVTAIVRGRGVRGDRVDDAVQDTLLTLHRARATYDPARPFLPWLRAIASRRAIDGLRWHGRRSSREVHDPLAYEAHADPGRSAVESLARSDQSRQLAAAVATLPDGQRQAVEHLALREASLEEVAALTGRSKGALKVNLHRALKALRLKLAEEPDGDA